MVGSAFAYIGYTIYLFIVKREQNFTDITFLGQRSNSVKQYYALSLSLHFERIIISRAF